MPTITPNGTVKLLKNVPFTNNYAHSIYFASVSDQVAYMNSKVDKTLTAQNYIKEESGSIKLQAQEENARDWNYMMWENPDLGGTPAPANTRWMYAFITQIDFVSPKVVRIHYEIDVLQTYALFNVTFKQCLIERRHTSTDTVGAHIEPEPVTFTNQKLLHRRSGDFFTKSYSSWRPLVFSSFNVVLGQGVKVWGERGGLFQGMCVNVFRSFSDLETYLAGISDQTYNEFTKNIVAMIAVPAEFAKIQGDSTDTAPYGVLDVDAVHSGNFYVPVYDSGEIDGYTPKNNKLFTFPYNCMHITNNEKDQMDLRYEFMKTTNVDDVKSARFHFSVAIQPSFEIRVMPYGYGGLGQGDKDYEHSITISDFPIVPWIADAYTQWLGTSKIGMYLSLLGTAPGIGISMAKGDPIGVGMGIANGANALGNFLDAQTNAQMASDGLHTGSASALMVDGGKDFLTFQKCLNEYDARRIDDFFTAFGYAINRIGTPNFTNGRKNQHYIKTNGCMVEGACPAEYAGKICSIFDSGVTWWDKDHVGQYN